MITYSFIIPHKNCTNLLTRCLKSIPKREDIEVMIVDDDSDSSLVNFEHFPGLDEPHTKCIFLKNGKGAGHARNVGISEARGKWLLFADCDDYYTPVISNLLDKYASDQTLDIVYLNAVKAFDDGRLEPLVINRYINNYLRCRFYSEDVLKFGFWTPWSRMVKREFVERNKILYEEVPVANDAYFCLNCSLFATKIDVYKEVVYCYYQFSTQSVTGNYYKNIQNLSSRIRTHFKINNIYKKANYYLFIPTIYSFRANNGMSVEQKSEYLKIRKNVLRENNYSYLRDTKRLIVYILAKLFKIL